LFFNFTPYNPPLLDKERGKLIFKDGLTPLLDTLKTVSQREAKPLLRTRPPSLFKGRGLGG
jgi:hypothetical protein